jgi:hypothetical protein
VFWGVFLVILSVFFGCFGLLLIKLPICFQSQNTKNGRFHWIFDGFLRLLTGKIYFTACFLYFSGRKDGLFQ